MRKVSRSALVPYSASQMYALVDDIEAYPEFLPWCQSTKVHTRDTSAVEASLELHRAGMSRTFMTRNSLYPHEAIELALIEGPFKQLSGRWAFQSLGDNGSKVSLKLQFEFDGKVTDMLFGPFFEDTCDSLVDAFTSRAAEVYGRSPNGKAAND